MQNEKGNSTKSGYENVSNFVMIWLSRKIWVAAPQQEGGSLLYNEVEEEHKVGLRVVKNIGVDKHHSKGEMVPIPLSFECPAVLYHLYPM